MEIKDWTWDDKFIAFHLKGYHFRHVSSKQMYRLWFSTTTYKHTLVRYTNTKILISKYNGVWKDSVTFKEFNHHEYNTDPKKDRQYYGYKVNY